MSSNQEERPIQGDEGRQDLSVGLEYIAVLPTTVLELLFCELWAKLAELADPIEGKASYAAGLGLSLEGVVAELKSRRRSIAPLEEPCHPIEWTQIGPITTRQLHRRALCACFGTSRSEDRGWPRDPPHI